ncbi:MAG: hypothetical protein QW350_00815 [Candidatus Aenigmatarchaeota archaeon]
MDFVLSKDEKIIPIEVKLSGNLKKGFYSFLDHYKPEKAIVVTLNSFEKIKYKKTTIYKLPAFYI